MNKIQHPRKQIVSLDEGMAWVDDGSHIWQQKLDGRFATREWRGHIIAGEQMADGEFIAWDLLATEGCDARGWGAGSRWNKLQILSRESLPWRITPFTTRNPANFLESVLRNGGEGVVRKNIYATYWDTMDACKCLQKWICRVVAFCGGSQSVEIADAATGEMRGKVALRGGKIDRVRIGSIIKVEGLCLTAKKAIRDSRVCSDSPTSWIVNF